MMKIICFFILSLLYLYVGISSGGLIQLPQTGQNKCYIYSSDDIPGEIPCTGVGQDGEVRAGVAWPSPRFTVSGDCVIDNLTGLM
ncbi:MAG: hypothetical protein AB1585_04665 [Thermodesulfobacteriota bacterium]